MVTLTNDFHDTKVRIRASVGDILTKSQIQRARRELCENPNCDCGGALGERGRQGVALEHLGANRVRIVQN